MKTTSMDTQMRRALLIAVSLAALWVVLAVARDGVTYHLAPLIVAAVPAAILGIEGKHPSGLLGAWALAGASLALGVTFLLSASGRLEGPSLLPFGGAAAEAVIFSAVGAIAGMASGLWTTRAD